jgi:hypothetical protein
MIDRKKTKTFNKCTIGYSESEIVAIGGGGGSREGR